MLNPVKISNSPKHVPAGLSHSAARSAFDAVDGFWMLGRDIQEFFMGAQSNG
jgi:hypothetical protein